ncbi:MAG: hypothetical protein J0L97_02230 [Alphaproteobacteria bacterium]|nr:hypothetical protein [Alphaproteobacteria bacterium]
MPTLRELRPHYGHFNTLPSGRERFLGAVKDTVLRPDHWILGALFIASFPEAPFLLVCGLGGAFTYRVLHTFSEGIASRSEGELRQVDKDHTVQKMAGILYRRHEIAAELATLGAAVDDRHPGKKFLHAITGWDILEHTDPNVHRRQKLERDDKRLDGKFQHLARSHSRHWEAFLRNNANDVLTAMTDPASLADIAADYRTLADHPHDTATRDALSDKLYHLPQSFVRTQQEAAITAAFAAAPQPSACTVLVTNYDTLLRSQERLKDVEKDLRKVHTPSWAAARFAAGGTADLLYTEQETLTTAIKIATDTIASETRDLPLGFAEQIKKQAENTVRGTLGMPLLP